jgi:pyruvate dehydrogenase E2 component (dihydrolipoamide acetyltransferase)
MTLTHETTTTRVRHSRMRRAIARTVAASAAVPQYSAEVEVDTTGLGETRGRLHEAGVRVSLTDLLHLAVVRALPHHPLLNASWTDTETLVHSAVNLTFILEVADGMLTPVIANAHSLGLHDLASRRRSLSAQALEGTLGPDELNSGTFTVSNLGAFGVRRFNAMVLPPQSAVLAVGSVTFDRMLSLTLSLDHRVVDGATAARFLHDLRRRLEEPTWMLTDHPASEIPR